MSRSLFFLHHFGGPIQPARPFDPCGPTRPFRTHARTHVQLCNGLTNPPAEAKKAHIPGSGFLHSVADSMRESSGIQRHDAPPKPTAAESPAGEMPEAGVAEKVAATIAGVAGASQVLGWGASGGKIKKNKSDVEGAAPSVGGGDVGVPSVEGGGADVPSVGGGVSAPSVEGLAGASAPGGDLTLSSGSMDAGGQLLRCD